MTKVELTAAVAEKWNSFRKRRRMHRLAQLLVRSREAKPELLRYLENLELKLECQARELKTLRWTLTGEQMADWDQELDKQEWLQRLGGVRN